MSVPPGTPEHFAAIGAKGGATKGATKSRGDSAYYAALVAKRKNKRGGNSKPLETA
jgi:hypothetical protein